MDDKFSPTPLIKLVQIILNQYNNRNSIFGISDELFFVSSESDPFRFTRFGQLLENPIGVAAGPHTQLAQNIVAAWFCGARYIELKTVQTLDNLEISKPCIDMQDEGYNCEWSQELNIQQTYDQYLDAWIIIHILKHLLEGKSFSELGTIFNMSLGYNLEGIKQENVQWFLSKMQDASVELEERIHNLQFIYPKIAEININPCISNNVTLSTMHGCPPDEIEKIGLYLLEEKNLHTTIKLNPTLLGKEKLNFLIQQSEFEAIVPDLAFDHDLKYKESIKIIKNLNKTAEKHNLFFGIKLSNTLECINHKDVFPEKEKMMYMSGSPLHPIAINLAEKLQNDFNGELNISFSAGVDAFNIDKVISCGLYPATVCSDILKPGGYGRLNQYIENLKTIFSKTNSGSIEELIIKKSSLPNGNPKASALKNLGEYAKMLINNKDYQKKSIKTQSIKTKKTLGIFDCIHAPCESTCPTHQGIPDYMYFSANADFDKAKKVILQTNPFPNTTGMVCDHICQSKCTRMNYDNPLLIRDVKRSISINSDLVSSKNDCLKPNNLKVAIIGAGPSGLACAYFLIHSGFEVNVYEKNENPGGMASNAIPQFRLDEHSINIDIENIQKLGVKVHFNQLIDKELFETLLLENNFIYIATGAQKTRPFLIEGSELTSVLNPLKFLKDVKSNKSDLIGKNVIVIGGGNTAIDAARTANRLIGKEGKVRLLYRRTIRQMPANEEELKFLMDEKIEIMELINPLKINSKNGKIQSLLCQKMKLGDKDAGGRAAPISIEGSEFELDCDTIIPAVGQEVSFDFIDMNMLKSSDSIYSTQISNVFIGGDALNSGLSVIAAIGDARKIAQIIIHKSGIDFETKKSSERPKAEYRELMIKKTKRIKIHNINQLNKNVSDNFGLVLSPLSIAETSMEASRCLLCDELCNICTIVCPNLALFAYQTNPIKKLNEKNEIIFELKQGTQILHITDWCNSCGNCNTFCPTSGAPYEHKPHLYLNKTAFGKAVEGYYFIYTELEQTLLYKNESEIHSFAENPINYSYITKAFSAQIEKQSFKIQDITYRNSDEKISLAKAIEMSIILDGARQFFGVEKKKYSSLAD
jgi:putative selenate reductase